MQLRSSYESMESDTERSIFMKVSNLSGIGQASKERGPGWGEFTLGRTGTPLSLAQNTGRLEDPRRQ